MWRLPCDKDATMRGRAMHPQVRREREKRERRATASAFGRRVASHLLRQSMTLRIVQSWNRPPFALYLYLRKFSKTHWRRRTGNMWPTHIFTHTIGKLRFSGVAATPSPYSPQHSWNWTIYIQILLQMWRSKPRDNFIWRMKNSRRAVFRCDFEKKWRIFLWEWNADAQFTTDEILQLTSASV